MERKKNHSLKENKQVNKENTYIGSIVTLVFSIVFAFVVLVSIQAIMGDKTVTIANNKAEQYYDGPDPIGKTHVREGVVVRIVNRPKFCAYKHKNFLFKQISGIISDKIADSNEVISEDILSEM